MSEEQQLKLEQLIHKRDIVKAASTGAKSHIESVVIDEASLVEMEQRRSKFEKYWEKCNALQDQIERLQINEKEKYAKENEEERTEFEEQYNYVLSKFDEMITRLSSPFASPGTSHGSNGDSSLSSYDTQIQLPSRDLPKFSGAYDEWFPFFDTYNSSIHLDESLTDVQKFQYLKSSLRGEAAEFIKSFEIFNENYTVTWNMLKKKYGNKRVIVQKHVKSMFDLLASRKKNNSALKPLVDEMLKHLRALKALGRPTDTWDDLMIFVITNKLNKTTQKKWEANISGTDMPTLQQLFDFLSRLS